MSRLLTTTLNVSQSRQDWEEQALALYVQDIMQAKPRLEANQANTESTTPATYCVLVRQVSNLSEALCMVQVIFKGVIRSHRLHHHPAAMKDIFEVVHPLSLAQSIEARETLGGI